MIKNNEIKEKIIRLSREENRTPKSLSEEFGVPLPTIYVWLRENKNDRVDRDRTEIERLFFEENRSFESMSDEFGIPTSIIVNWIRSSKTEKTEEQKKTITEYLRKSRTEGNTEQIQNLNDTIKELQEKNKYLENTNRLLTEYMMILKKQLEEK